MSETKTCKTCLEEKPLTEFYRACRSRKCAQSYCIECFKAKNKKKYIKVADRPNYTPKKVGRKKVQLTQEQLEIIKLHKGTLADLARELNINYETLKYYKRMGKFQMN